MEHYRSIRVVNRINFHKSLKSAPFRLTGSSFEPDHLQASNLFQKSLSFIWTAARPLVDDVSMWALLESNLRATEQGWQVASLSLPVSLFDLLSRL